MPKQLTDGQLQEALSDFNDLKENLGDPRAKSGVTAMTVFSLMLAPDRKTLGGQFALYAAARDHVGTLTYLENEGVDLAAPVVTGEGTRQTPLQAAETSGSQKAAAFLRGLARTR